MATKTATIESYHIWGTRGTRLLRLTHYDIPLAEQLDTGRDAMRAVFAIAQAQGFTHARYQDDRGSRARAPLNTFYNRHCL